MRIKELFALSETWLGRSHLVIWLADLAISASSAVFSGYLGSIEGWQWVFVIFIVIGVAVVVFVGIGAISFGLSWFFLKRLIPLHVVARRIYEKSQGSKIAEAVEREARTPDQILDVFANFVMSAVDVYAKRLPSTKYTCLHLDEMQALKSTNAAKNLYHPQANTIMYGSPHVRREDIKHAMGFVEALGGPI